MPLDRGKEVVKDESSSGEIMMNNDKDPNNPCWNEKSRAWSRTRGRGGWKAISFHDVPTVLISNKKANCCPDFSFQSGPYRPLLYFSFQ
jgi:hypothetical protein